MIDRLLPVIRRIRGPLIVAAAGGLLVLGVNWAYGGFGEYYELTVDLPRAGQQTQLGTDVRMRGVVIGQVSSIELVDRHARLTLRIEERYRVPAEARAVISLKTLLGAKFVDLRFEEYGGPFLAAGDRIRTAVVGPELEDALRNGVEVLAALSPDDVATIVGELAEGARGHGEDVARGLRAGSELSSLFARTLPSQVEALHDFRVIFGALRDRGVDLNALADAVNEGAPVYASEEAQRALRRALEAVAPFADDLADLLILEKDDWDRMIDSGDRVLQTIALRPGGLRDLVHGLYRYVFNLGGAPYLVGDDRAAAPFVNFIGGNDSEENHRQLCAAFPPELRRAIPLCVGGVR